ncbi:MAG: PBP1A family penicillin-binding protein [Patescibacteria group bacterium]
MKRKISSPYNQPSWRRPQLHHVTKRRNYKNQLWRLFIVIFLLGVISLLGLFIWASRDLPTPEGIAHRIIPQSTKIYDRTGQIVLYDIHGEERRTSVELNDIPDYLKQATLTAEDRNFYNHKGFRFTSMVRSLLVNILSGSLSQGGSTITQQFIKNAIVGGEKKYTRKIKEVILAYQIERKFSKDEILKLYFNEIPYGSNAYGAEAAAQMFFGKSVRDLNLAESALLAAIPKAPSYYSPWGTHKDELLARQQYIIDEMVSLNYITADTAQVAKDYKLQFVSKTENIIAPHFIFFIKEQVAAKYGERTVEQGGLKIITTLDIEAQKNAETAIAESAEKNNSYQASNAALVALDPKSGQILAMVGSRDFFDDSISGQVNVVTRPRQPGSSFKPFVYAAALAKGYTPDTILFDVVTTFKTETKDYEPHNYDDREHGPVSLKTALAGSLNIPAVKLLYLVGIDNILDLASQLGYTTLKDRSRFGLSLVLGGAEIKLIEHTNAYASLAREGNFLPTTGILKIEDSTGKTLEEYQQPVAKKILAEQTARQITNILSDNSAREYIFGANNYLTLPARPVVAKTGTTNDYRDAWTLGYTPSLVAGVWVGNSDNSEMKRGADGSVLAAPIWQSFMTKTLVNKPAENFTPSETITVDKPMLNGYLSGEEVLIDRASGKLATDLTPTNFIERRRYKQYHSILRYVNKDDPLGTIPSRPEDDPQYLNWETAVTRWTNEQGYTNEQPPTEFDDVHIAINKPTINLTTPTDNETIKQNPTIFTVATNARRGIRRVEYFLDNQLVGEAKSFPWSLNYQFTDELTNGFHNLTVKAYDDVDNSAEDKITFNLQTTLLSSPYHVSWLNPTDNARLNINETPINIKLQFDNPQYLTKVDLYYQATTGGSNWLGYINKPQTINQLIWSPASTGVYKLFLILTDKTGGTKNSRPITVTIE